MAGEQVLALVCPIAEEVDDAILKEAFDQLFVNDDSTRGLHFAESLVVERHINLHAAGINHGAIEGAFLHLGVGMEHHLAAHGLQRRNGDQWFLQTKGKSFGFADANAETRVGAGTFRNSHGIGHRIVLAGIFHRIFHVLAEYCGMVWAFQCLARKFYSKVTTERDATGFRRRLNHKNIGHIGKRG